MLKNISNLGSKLNKSEQQSINGGRMEPHCTSAGALGICPPEYYHELSTNCCYKL